MKKRKFETKFVIFLLATLFFAFVILSCSSKSQLAPDTNYNYGEDSVNIAISIPEPTLDSDISSSGDSTIIPTWGDYTNLTTSESDETPTPRPAPLETESEPKPDQTPDKPNESLSTDSYYDVHYFQGLNLGNGYYVEKKISYKDTLHLSYLWTNTIITNFCFIKGSGSKLLFKPNGDVYWEKKPNTILKKFEGGTIVMYRGGEFGWGLKGKWMYTVGGVYTYGISRSEANSFGNAAINKMFNQKYDGGGKKGKVEILVINSGYLFNGGTGRPGHTRLFSANHAGLLLHSPLRKNFDEVDYPKYAGLQSYNQRADDDKSKYLGKTRPDTRNGVLGYMQTMENTWDLWE